jgi:hypothetical protein
MDIYNLYQSIGTLMVRRYRARAVGELHQVRFWAQSFIYKEHGYYATKEVGSFF